jgi:hypothetical protein
VGRVWRDVTLQFTQGWKSTNAPNNQPMIPNNVSFRHNALSDWCESISLKGAYRGRLLENMPYHLPPMPPHNHHTLLPPHIYHHIISTVTLFLRSPPANCLLLHFPRFRTPLHFRCFCLVFLSG